MLGGIFRTPQRQNLLTPENKLNKYLDVEHSFDSLFYLQTVYNINWLMTELPEFGKNKMVVKKKVSIKKLELEIVN